MLKHAVSVAALLFAVGCKERSGSEVQSVDDAKSITRVAPGQFDTVCDDGTVQTVTSEDILENRVCTGRIQLYRAYRVIGAKTSFLYTFNQQEPAPIGYTLEGPVFRVYSKADHAGMATMVRCIRSDGVLFNSTDGNCEGLGTGQGTIGYVYATPAPHTIPVYRCTKGGGLASAVAVIMSTSVQDCANQGFQSLGPIAYIAP